MTDLNDNALRALIRNDINKVYEGCPPYIADGPEDRRLRRSLGLTRQMRLELLSEKVLSAIENATTTRLSDSCDHHAYEVRSDLAVAHVLMLLVNILDSRDRRNSVWQAFKKASRNKKGEDEPSWEAVLNYLEINMELDDPDIDIFPKYA